MKTLAEFLQSNAKRNVNEHRLVASVSEDGLVSFYIHPLNADGETPMFAVEGNSLALVNPTDNQVA